MGGVLYRWAQFANKRPQVALMSTALRPNEAEGCVVFPLSLPGISSLLMMAASTVNMHFLDTSVHKNVEVQCVCERVCVGGGDKGDN